MDQNHLQSIPYKDIIKTLPDTVKGSVSPPDAVSGQTTVILDDDPTGCQTVYDVAVSFSWKVEDLIGYFREKCRLLFILTNSRSMSAKEAELTYREIMQNLVKAKQSTGQELVVISRSDSTLRGHYPLELDVISSFLPSGPYMHCLIPAFFSGGRYTLNDIHYVREDDLLVPAAETPFAKDRAFGFYSSDLKQYIEEKQDGRIQSDQVLSFSIHDLRLKGPDFVTEKLLSSDQPACIVNAADHADLDVFAAGARDAIGKGKKLLFRTAASFINSFAGIPEKKPLDRNRLRSDRHQGGLIMVGSYVEKSTRQLNMLLDQGDSESIEVNVNRLISDEAVEEIWRVSLRMNQLIHEGKNVVIFTSRELVSEGRGEQNLDIGKRVSDALVKIVNNLEGLPSFFVAKGGITSHDIATRGLGISTARVIGQALPGLPVIETPRLPGMKYIIFPGNVGNDGSLLELYNKLKQ
jgi:uncharacterized protein YgbK (DUF1537 family)